MHTWDVSRDLMTEVCRNLETPTTQIRAPASTSGKWGSELLQIPSRGEGRLARRASWDRELPGWILGPGADFDQRAKRSYRCRSL
eukprot:5116773-Alexandrium_andersonii.AAC.1